MSTSQEALNMSIIPQNNLGVFCGLELQRLKFNVGYEDTEEQYWFTHIAFKLMLSFVREHECMWI